MERRGDRFVLVATDLPTGASVPIPGAEMPVSSAQTYYGQGDWARYLLDDLPADAVGPQPAPPPRQTIDAARGALERFMQLAHDGRYADAVALAAGADYSALREWNGDVAPDDLAGLLERGCRRQIRCLVVRRVVDERVVSATRLRFTVELGGDDGSVFTLGPCCGADAADMPPRSRFPFTVDLVGGRPVVMDLPPYVP